MIDVHRLPSLPLVNLSQLPKCSCIYFVMHNSRIIYIGQTINLADRWTGHHKLSQLTKLNDTIIAWLKCSDQSLLVEIESAMIQHFQPKLNKQGGGKRSHPDYRQTTIYINKQIEKRMKAAFLEDEVEDFSQWIEERIEEWLKGRKQG